MLMLIRSHLAEAGASLAPQVRMFGLELDNASPKSGLLPGDARFARFNDILLVRILHPIIIIIVDTWCDHKLPSG